jgi:anti-sigma regulatory factor (Ser/Thr protein kinase)
VTARDDTAAAPRETGRGRVGTTVARRFAPSYISVGQARHFLRAQFGDDDRHPDVELLALMVSELATNAVLHARTAFEIDVWVTPDANGHTVLVCVSDEAPRFPVPHDPPTDAGRGRGLLIVESLSSGWGIEARPGRPGKTVWFAARVGTAGRAGPTAEGSGGGHAAGEVMVGGGDGPVPPIGDARRGRTGG